jgi:hypothetical protein
MESSENKDHLNFRKQNVLPSIIGEEELLLSDKLIKINRYGLSQERNILITNKAIYNLKKKSNLYIIINSIILYFSFKKTNSLKYYIRNNSK